MCENQTQPRYDMAREAIGVQVESGDLQPDLLPITFPSISNDSDSSQFFESLENLADRNVCYTWSNMKPDIASETNIAQFVNLPFQAFDVRHFRETEQKGFPIPSTEYLTTSKLSTQVTNSESSGQHYKPNFDADYPWIPLNGVGVESRSLVDPFSQEYQMTVCDFEHNSSENTVSPTHEITSPRVTFKSKLKQNTNNNKESRFKTIPLINEVTPLNYGKFLVGVLRDILNDIPLDAFYNLLYNSPKDFVNYVGDSQKKIDPRIGLEGIRICSHIIDLFKMSNGGNSYTDWASIQTAQLSSVNFEEFLRTFLAIKILFDSIKEIDLNSLTPHGIPRTSMYDAYCEVSQKLYMCFKSSGPNQFSHYRNTLMGKAQFGRLINLVFPNLKIRRLGRRGESRPHYMGITWNRSIVDTEMIRKVERKLLKPAARLRVSKQEVKKHESTYTIPKAEKFIENLFQHDSNELTGYSFIHASSRLPEVEFLPRSWQIVTGRVPEQSIWFRKVMLRSVKSLKKYNIDMWPVIQNFHANIFSSLELSGFLTDFTQRMKILIDCNSDKEGYMHLYLTILLLVFPVIITSDEEVVPEVKVQLRKNLIFFINRVKLEFPDLPDRESYHLLNFFNIIRKMVHMNEMSLSQVKTGLTESIIQEIAFGIHTPSATPHSDLSKRTLMEETIFRALFLASNASKQAFDESQKCTTEGKECMMKIVEAFVDFSSSTTQGLLKISKSMSSQDLKRPTFDLPFQLFKEQSLAFHRICFSDPFIKKFPIRVINYILLQLHKETQNAIFVAYGKRDREVSKETFKTWWIFSTLAEEYVQILAEIVALNGSLGDN